MDEFTAEELMNEAAQDEIIKIDRQRLERKIEYLSLKRNPSELQKQDIYYGLGRLNARVSYPADGITLKYYENIVEAYDLLMPFIEFDEIKNSIGIFREVAEKQIRIMKGDGDEE